ncbi:Uncharacterised protein [uncultured archaeon]|nr:Uncharacterised protein [uncultured archaeon]
MNFKISIALSFSLFALFAIGAQSIIDGGAGLSADQLIDASRGIYIHNPNVPENPQESRVLWSTTGKVNSTRLGNISADRATSASQIQSSQETLAISASATSAAGNWSFRLRDRINRFVALTLFQSGDAIFGMGTINDGGDTMTVSSSGSLEGNKMSLDVTISKTKSLYRLSLTKNGTTAYGDYMAFWSGGDPWTGIAEGMQNPAQN